MSLERRKKELIEIIEWYRDEYHRQDFCHSSMIEKIKTLDDERYLTIYEQVVDGWLD